MVIIFPNQSKKKQRKEDEFIKKNDSNAYS